MEEDAAASSCNGGAGAPRRWRGGVSMRAGAADVRMRDGCTARTESHNEDSRTVAAVPAFGRS